MSTIRKLCETNIFKNNDISLIKSKQKFFDYLYNKKSCAELKV